MLHILNGDATAAILKQTDIPGVRLPWREAFMTGATPRGLSHEDWISVRVNFLAGAYEQNIEEW